MFFISVGLSTHTQFIMVNCARGADTEIATLTGESRDDFAWREKAVEVSIMSCSDDAEAALGPKIGENPLAQNDSISSSVIEQQCPSQPPQDRRGLVLRQTRRMGPAMQRLRMRRS